MYSWKERSVEGSWRWLLRNLLRAIFVWTGLALPARMQLRPTLLTRERRATSLESKLSMKDERGSDE
jgi:hypothetical protein